MKAQKFQRSSCKGFTLIEIMITLVIIGLIMGIGISVLFPGPEAKLRDSAGRLAGTLKYLYNEAIVKDKFYRVVFDLDQQTYSVESRDEPFLLGQNPADSTEKGTALGKPTEEVGGTAEGEEEEAAIGPDEFVQEEGYLVQPTTLPKGIKFKDIFAMHLKGKAEQGRVEGYVFPQGWIEPMVINMCDEEEEVFYSLEVNPITGSSKIRSQYFEVTPERYFPEEQP